MSLRKAKLLLEQKRAQQKKIQIQQDQESEEEQQVQKNSMFDFGDDNSDDDNQQQTKVEQKQKDNSENAQQVQKKKKKKKKKKMTQQQQFQQALKQLGIKTQKKQTQKIQQSPEWEKILQINESKFNYQKQLKRHFKNWQQEKPEKDGEIDKRTQRMQKHLKKQMKKSVLSPGIKEFVPIRQKFDIVQQQHQSKIRFVPSKKYEHYQVEYDALRNSNDINALFMFTQTHPQHVDSIYSVGQFLRLQGNYRDADAMIQRVIYIYQMAGSYQLTQFIKEDLVKKQIVYDTYSTSFFMSIFKFMQILGKKGCFKAALEYNKFLFKINTNDPSACLLCLDYNAISAKQNQYLLSFITYFSHYIGQSKKSLYLMPNFIYSFALAKFHIENTLKKNQQNLLVEQNNMTEMIGFSEDDWKQALTLPTNQSFLKESCRVLLLRAIMIYPKLMLDIADKNEYKKQFLNHPKFQENQKKSFKNILEHDFWKMVPTSYSYHFLDLQNQSDSKGLDKVLQVYVQRSKILWKSNQVMLWMKGATGFILNQIDKEFDYQAYLQNLCTEQCGGIPIPFSLSRYQNISKANFSDRVDRIDLNNIQDNQNIQHQQQHLQENANRMNVQGNGFQLFLNSLLPWVNLPANNQGEQNDPNMPFIEDDDDYL